MSFSKVCVMLGVATLAFALAAAIAVAAPDDASRMAPMAAATPEAGKKAFLDVVRVLQSPRCMNCHPSGDAPLQTDKGKAHAMNISRASVHAGLSCSTCHQERNSEAVGVKGGPPGAPRWNLPPDDAPMVFQGKTPTALCEQLKDPARNGKKDFAALVEHVEKDPLVLWGWRPGGTRTIPPLAHAAFVDAFKTWVASGGACP